MSFLKGRCSETFLKKNEINETQKFQASVSGFQEANPHDNNYS